MPVLIQKVHKGFSWSFCVFNCTPSLPIREKKISQRPDFAMKTNPQQAVDCTMLFSGSGPGQPIVDLMWKTFDHQIIFWRDHPSGSEYSYGPNALNA
jgi:hypothetical protein